MSVLPFKEHYFLNSIYRYEKLFGPKNFHIKKDGTIQSKQVSQLVDLGYLEISVLNKVVMSKFGKEYIESKAYNKEK